MLYDVVDLGDDDIKIRAIALQAASISHAGKGSVGSIIRTAQQFEKYLKTGQTR